MSGISEFAALHAQEQQQLQQQQHQQHNQLLQSRPATQPGSPMESPIVPAHLRAAAAALGSSVDGATALQARLDESRPPERAGGDRATAGFPVPSGFAD